MMKCDLELFQKKTFMRERERENNLKDKLPQKYEELFYGLILFLLSLQF